MQARLRLTPKLKEGIPWFMRTSLFSDLLTTAHACIAAEAPNIHTEHIVYAAHLGFMRETWGYLASSAVPSIGQRRDAPVR